MTTTPDILDTLGALADERAAAEAARDAVLERLRAAALAALRSGRPEAEVARVARVDRMTVRRWAGKR